MSKAHIIGICGSGMSAVAKLLKDSGWEITGSDDGFYPPISDLLIEYGIACHSGYAAANIPPDADVIVIGKHARLIPEENDEVRAAFTSGIAIKSYPDVLETMTVSTDNYVICGSFGKSTCASLTTWILMQAGKDPSFMIGALSRGLGVNARLGEGGIFVLEGDEYPSANWDNSSKFLHFNARHILLTSGEHDHVNVFPTVEDYLEPYKQLVGQSGLKTITACLDGENVPLILAETAAAVTTYSLSNPQADWRAGSIARNGQYVEFDLLHGDRIVCRLETLLLGEHNVQNIVGVSALLLGTGAVTQEELAEGVRTFQGVRRRLEMKTSGSSIPLYEDFGSSRAKLLAGVSAVRKQYPDRKLHIVFEPHTFSFRNRNALAWYDDLFIGANEVHVFEPPTHGAAGHEQLSLEEIVERINQSGVSAVPVRTKEELLLSLKTRIAGNESVVLVETSGNAGGAIPYLTQYLDETFGL